MRCFPILLLLVSVAPGEARGQEIIPTLDSIGPGCCTIRVRGTEGSAEGKFQGKPAPGRITLTPCKGNLCPPVGGTQGSLAVPPGAQVEMYAGRAVGKGLVWGALIGAVTLTAIWLGDQDLDQSVGGKIAAGIPLGGIIGGAAGALIGALFPRWTPVRP